MMCRHCDKHIPDRDYKQAWKELMAKGWTREQIRARSPSCLACSSQLKKDDHDATRNAPDRA